MNNTYINCAVLCLSFSFNTFCHAISTDKAASDFFEHYQKLEKNYDPQLKTLFLDQAQVSNTKYGDETEMIYKMTGKKLKTMMEDLLKYAQASNNYDRYSQVQIQPLNATDYKITAHRYSLNNCYNDTSFNMTIQKQADQSFKILALHSSDTETSQCTQPLKQDIPAKLQIIATAANKDLPKQLDRMITLTHVSAENTMLSYHYQLDILVAENLNDKIIMNIEDSLTLENCQAPQLKAEMDLGMQVQHLFYDANEQLLINHVVNSSSCDAFFKK